MKNIDWKKLSKKLLFPPLWVILILTVISTAGLILVFTQGMETHPIAYVVYVISFYTVCADTVFFCFTFPQYYRAIKGKIYSNEYGNRYMTDVEFKTHVSLYLSLGINLLYVATNLVSGIWYRSVWSVTLAAYHAILAVMRFLLLRFFNRNGIGKERILDLSCARLCGIILLTLNLALSGVVLLVIVQDAGFRYPGIMIYVMAMYTFYTTVTAIINLVKYRKYNSPVLSATKIIKMAAAMVSMLSLETAMLTEFAADENPEHFNQIMVGATGAVVCVIVVVMSVYTIVKTTQEIRALKRQNS